MKTNLLKNTALGMIASLAMAGQVRAESWDFGAGTTNWDDALNWNTDTVPGVLPAPSNPVNSTGFSQSQSPIITGSTSSISVPELQVGVVGTGFVTINGGSVHANTMYVGMFTGGNGTVAQNGGTVTAGDFNLGYQNNAHGTYNLTGGSLTVSSNTAISAGNSGSVGTFNISGGSFQGANAQIANFTTDRLATVAVSGSAQVAFSSTVELGVGGSGTSRGTLLIDGGKTGSGTNFSADRVVVSTAGTLAFNIDAASPLTLRTIQTTTGQFDLGSILDLGFTGTATNGSWTVWTSVAGINDSGLALAAGDAAAGWSYALTNSNHDLTVSFAAVPEPCTYVLMLGGLVALVGLRKMRNTRV